MSTGKHFSALCALVLALALAVTVLFMNGEALGIRVIRDEDSETNEDSGYFTSNDQNTAWTAATAITLSGDTATAGTRTPVSRKSKPVAASSIPSGLDTGCGGTWSKKPPCSS